MQIYLLITEKCNLSCSMCIRGHQEGDVLSIENLKKILKRGDFNNQDIVLTGGEPTLHPNFCDIVGQICAVAKTVIITSNGILNYYIDTVKKYDNLRIQISLDGEQKVHDKIRGVGTYYKTMETIKILDKSGIPYSVATVVNRDNVFSMKNLCLELEKLNKLLFWKLSYEMPFANKNFEKMMSSNEWNTFVDNLIKQAKLRLHIKKIFPFELYQKYKDIIKKSNIMKNRCFNCGSGSQKIYIYPNLNVYPCTCLVDFCVGNLMESRLENICSSEKMKPFLNYKIDNNTVCNTCEYKVICNGGCIGMSYHYYGVLGKGDIRCSKLGVL